ncbi:MAG: transcription elongation factor GreA [Selenomonadales bacterium]|nr:transcription elongation factor GreA [Selenomonadales bacterium]
MSEKEVLLTAEGRKKLEDELEHLKMSKRPEVAERIREAIGHGDISENSEYDDAKNEQAFVEGRILTLESMLRNARLIDTTELDHTVVGVGSTVILYDVEAEEELEYTLVGSAEASPLQHKISNESPVGRAVMGKKVGDTVEVSVPVGMLKYEVREIR